MTYRLLEHFVREYEMTSQAVKFEAPGDRKAALERIIENIHRLIIQASNMQQDGKSIDKKLDQIEAEFDKLGTI